MQAAEALSLGSQVAGQAYFITNDDPQPFWGFADSILKGLDFPPKLRPHIRLPYILVYLIALLMEYVIIPLVKPFKSLTVEFTPTAVTLSSCSRQLSCQKAKTQFGYDPQVSIQEAQKRTWKAFSHLRYKPTTKKSS